MHACVIVAIAHGWVLDPTRPTDPDGRRGLVRLGLRLGAFRRIRRRGVAQGRVRGRSDRCGAGALGSVKGKSLPQAMSLDRAGHAVERPLPAVKKGHSGAPRPRASTSPRASSPLRTTGTCYPSATLPRRFEAFGPGEGVFYAQERASRETPCVVGSILSTPSWTGRKKGRGGTRARADPPPSSSRRRTLGASRTP